MILKQARAQVAGGTGEGTMTAIRMTSDRLTASAVSSGVIVRLLLASGALSFISYVATDILGGLRYPGYDFTSQAISELGAIGAPTAGLVGPLFFIYGVLVLAFAVGVYLEGARRGNELRITGAVLMGYAVIGFASPFARMHQRGAGSLDTDLWHILLTVVLVALLLVAMGSAAIALGRRFRMYSIATMVVVVAFGAWTGTYAARLAAGLPTPGMGIIERIDVYAAMLWTAVLSSALLRTRPHSSGANHRIAESGNSSNPDSRFRIPGGFAARSDDAGAGMFARVPTAVTSDPE